MRIALIILFFSFSTAITASPAWADVALSLSDSDQIWILVCTVLVLLMHVGFLFLESGACRLKNAANAAFKNLSNMLLSGALFMAVGQIVAFGPTFHGFLGAGLVDNIQSKDGILLLLFNAAFCATAATLVSGAIAERFSLKPFLVVVALMALVIYPVPVHWIFGNLIETGNKAFLADLGFVDYAGATAVHGVGAWVALAAIIHVGPRLGRFDPDTGKPRYLDGYSPILTIAGAVLLIVGWLGFNGGAGLSFGENVSLVLENTIIGGFWGGSFALLICIALGWKLHPTRVVEGTISGLVAVTAAPHLFSIWMSVLVVSLAVIAAFSARHLILKAGLDDVVNVVATHGVAGVVGTLAVAFAVPAAELPAGGHLAQLGAQATGVAIVFVWSFGLAWLSFWLLKHVLPLRVTHIDEERGLSFASNGVGFSAERFARELEALLTAEGTERGRISLPEGDENARLAELFNGMLDDLDASSHRERTQMEVRTAQQETMRAAAEERSRAAEDALSEREKREAAELELRKTADVLASETRRQLEDSISQADEIARLVAEIGDGQLSVRIPMDGKSEAFGKIADGVNSLVDDLSSNIGRIAFSADEVMESCDNLQNISNTLQMRSGSQLDSVQAITFRLTRMAEGANVNATLATEALTVAKESEEASHDITRGLHEIGQAMEAITDRTSKIAPIVDLIEEIAFQTTLLALNASVEAARAGSHGDGFAVVAQEVRNLADRVHGSASEIRSIVEVATNTVADGGHTIGETSMRVAKVGDTIRRVSSQITDIHGSSTSLHDQLEELGKVVEEITAAASANAAIAAETSDGADVLSRLGGELLDAVSSFSGYTPTEGTKRDEIEEDEDDEEGGMLIF